MKALDILSIDAKSRRPKYRQVVDGIIENINAGKIEVNEKIPSINALSEKFALSRDTVEKAYRILKERNIITSVRGKGYYVTGVPQSSGTKVLFLINKLSSYKMQVYRSFLAAAGPDTYTDLHIYHCDESLFLQLLEKNSQSYDYYVIMLHFKTNRMRHVSITDKVVAALAELPDHKVLILDNQIPTLAGKYAEVYQDFEDDLYTALKSGQAKIKEYAKCIIAYPLQSVYPYPHRILRGFRKFCVEAKLSFEVINAIDENRPLEKGTLYLTISESDLVNLVKAARDQQFQPGRDIGIISYNETPLKDLLGITTVSTNFEAMGRISANLVVNRLDRKVKNEFLFTHRDSL